MSKFKIYFKSILIPVLVGALIGLITSNSIDYSSLIQPPFAPPSFLFPIVWTILYILMGVSYGIIKENNLLTPEIQKIYYSQLAVNALWSIFFFSLKWRLFAGFEIILLALLIGIMISKFYHKNRLAAYLQLPYLAWVLYATYLNWSIYLLNK
jgi:tryptophan-rich sensory protein